MGYAADTYARLTRNRWAEYANTFVPLENHLIDYATNPDTVSNAMSTASQNVQGAFDAQGRRVLYNEQGGGIAPAGGGGLTIADAAARIQKIENGTGDGTSGTARSWK